jgi:type I restriction enzyme, S subunit
MKRWPTKPLGSFCRTGSGGTPSRKKPEYFDGGTVPWVKSGELKDSVVFNTAEKITVTATKESNAHIIPRNAVLVAMYGATVGETAILGVDAATNQAVCHIIPDPDTAHFRFVWYALKSRLDELLSKRVGGAQPNISQGIIRETVVPVPPMPEQERIVKLLDKADELRKLRSQADHRTATLIPGLFHEMFGDPVANLINWPVQKLPDVCDGKEGIKAGPFGSSLKKDCYIAEGPRVYGQEQVIADDFSVGDYHISEAKFAEMSAYKVAPGDVLISLVGTIGRVAIVPDGIERGIINPRLLRIRPCAEALHPVFLAHVLTSPSVTRLFGSVATGMTMGVLNAGLLKRFSIPIPPLPLQKEFAQRVAEIRALETAQATSRTRLDALFQSMLHCAFNGEL